jgi:hypothetical protein
MSVNKRPSLFRYKLIRSIFIVDNRNFRMDLV